MPKILIFEVLLFCFILALVILSIVKRGRITVKYSLVWFVAILIIAISVLIPNFMIFIAKLLGFQTVSNLIFSLLIMLLIFICISLTIIISGQKEKIRLLIQEVSILKKGDK